MTKKFIIEDEIHAEPQGTYNTFEEAVEELKKRMKIPWNKEPNVCPCTGWKTCARHYEIIEYDTSKEPWKEINKTLALIISSKETKWLLN